MIFSDVDHEISAQVVPETVQIQNNLLDATGSVLAMLRTLSPNLIELLAGDVVDHAQYDQLLQIGFSSPTFEQEVKYSNMSNMGIRNYFYLLFFNAYKTFIV